MKSFPTTHDERCQAGVGLDTTRLVFGKSDPCTL
jgi:hypothetical protein